MSERRERSYDLKTFEPTRKIFEERERAEMSMKESENVDGEDETYVKIDADSKKKTIRWKSLKEMKEYLRSEFEKKASAALTNRGQTYLHFAAYLGDVDATKRLIEDNAEVNGVDRRKATALCYAASKGHADVANVLIRNGADVNALDYWYQRALHLAARYGHADVAKVLIQNGADVNAVDENNASALHFASLNGHIDVAKVLIQNGADVNAVNIYKRRRHFTRQLGKDMLALRKCCSRTVLMWMLVI